MYGRARDVWPEASCFLGFPGSEALSAARRLPSYVKTFASAAPSLALSGIAGMCLLEATPLLEK